MLQALHRLTLDRRLQLIIQAAPSQLIAATLRLKILFLHLVAAILLLLLQAARIFHRLRHTHHLLTLLRLIPPRLLPTLPHRVLTRQLQALSLKTTRNKST